MIVPLEETIGCLTSACSRRRTNEGILKVKKHSTPPRLMRQPLCRNGFSAKSMAATVVIMMDEFMKAAIEEAKKGAAQGGIPIGSVLVKNGEIIGRGHNKRVQENDPILHAEIDCLRNAGRLGSYSATVLYSTLMPCYLCAGAVVQFGIKKVVVGESNTFPGARQFMEEHGVEVVDLDLQEFKEMMDRFISKNINLWKEDIGELQ